MIFDTALPNLCQENKPCKSIGGLIKLKTYSENISTFWRMIFIRIKKNMIPGFEAIVEERIKKAQKDGEFKNLKGLNEPLKFEDQHIPEELRLSHKILKNAGFLPPEVELKKKITQTEDLLEKTGLDSPERFKIQKKLNWLLAKLNSTRSGRQCSPIVLDNYNDNIIKKIS